MIRIYWNENRLNNSEIFASCHAIIYKRKYSNNDIIGWKKYYICVVNEFYVVKCEEVIYLKTCNKWRR